LHICPQEEETEESVEVREVEEETLEYTSGGEIEVNNIFEGGTPI
jgi:hypothetical protein